MRARSNSLAIIAIICGIWFLFTGSIWIYYANLVLGYPIAIIGLICWNRSRKLDGRNRLNQAALILLTFGLAMSMVSLLILLIYN